MSKPRLKLTAIIDTEAHADTIISQVRNKLIGKDIFEEHYLGKFVNEDEQIELVSELRFNSHVDMDNVKDWAKTQFKNHPQIKNWVISAKVINHLCTHDDSSLSDCRTTEYMEWIK